MPSRYVSAARNRLAVRALAEGAPVTFELLADAAGRTAEYWTSIAEEEGWRMSGDVAAAAPEALEQRLMMLSDRMVSELEALSSEGQVTGRYDKSKIDALSALMRMVEKLGEATRVPERAAEKQKKDDAELAAALNLIDARIVELACELAATMGGGEPGRAAGLPDSG